MLMSKVIAILFIIAVLSGILTGRMGDVSLAVVTGAKEGVSLIISIAGTICLWSGLMKVMSRSGLAEKFSKLLKPVIRLLFKEDAKDKEASEAIAQNMTANILGLGSAATPAGLKAAKRLDELAKARGEYPHRVLLLIIINTASVQLLPTTIAAVRAAAGSQTPYDILPSVWVASIASVLMGIFAAKIFKGTWKND